MIATHTCKECRHYRAFGSSASYFEKYNFCGWERRNQFNHEVLETGQLVWNEHGRCPKFEGKQRLIPSSGDK